MPNAKQNNKTDTLGIVSVVLAFTGLHIPGLIIGIVGEKNAKREGRAYNLSRIGWIVNLVILIVTVIVIGIFIALIPSHRNKVYDLTVKDDFINISKQLEIFHNKNGYYPPSLENPGLQYMSFYVNQSKPYKYKVIPAGCTQCKSYTLETTLHNADAGATAYVIKSKY